MATHVSARKKVRRDARACQVNTARRSRIRTILKRAVEDLQAKNKAAAEASVVKAQSELMRGVSKGVMHKNTAARRISQLFLKLKSL